MEAICGKRVPEVIWILDQLAFRLGSNGRRAGGDHWSSLPQDVAAMMRQQKLLAVRSLLITHAVDRQSLAVLLNEYRVNGSRLECHIGRNRFGGEKLKGKEQHADESDSWHVSEP